jgi:hypothetical protein
MFGFGAAAPAESSGPSSLELAKVCMNPYFYNKQCYSAAITYATYIFEVRDVV